MEETKILKGIENYRDDMAASLMEMCAIPAINPTFGGAGEYERMRWIMKFLDKHAIPYQVIEVADSRVKEQKRLNVLVKLEGSAKSDQTLWFIAHTDTVSAGDMAAWNSDPFKPLLKDGKIYGRGTEDNGQANISSLYACMTLKEQDVKPKCNVGFAFVSDEEAGSQFGFKSLVAKGVFKANDEAIVPDSGSPDGSFIEIAEKSIAWVRITVVGKQGHASMPNLGINASSVSTHFGAELEDRLKSIFSDRDDLFDPPYSTFELTQKYANVDSPNILPGKDVFVMDMRILPKFKIAEIGKEIDRLSAIYEYRHKVKISYEFLQRVDAPLPTPSDARVVANLARSLSDLGITPRMGGIGGGTFAAMLRELGIPAAVWSTIDELAHQPNEYAIVANLVQDAKVFVATALKYR
jgi:succinyl-diaminopimelate desuccinylase